MPDDTRPSDLSAELRGRLAAFRLSPQDEASIVAELTQHVEDRVAELSRTGMTPADARHVTLEELSQEELRRGGWRRLPRHRPPAPAPGALWPWMAISVKAPPDPLKMPDVALPPVTFARNAAVPLSFSAGVRSAYAQKS